MMGTPRRSNAELQLSDAESEDEDETESASVSLHVVSRDGHEVPLESELVNTVNLPAVAIEIQKDFLTSIRAGVTQRFPELSFVMSYVSVDSSTKVPVLMISQRRLFVHPPYGMVSRIQGYVEYKIYSVHVLMRLWRKECFENIEEITALCEIIGEGSNYKFCPGINSEQYMKEYYDVIRFHIKSVRLTDCPFQRVDSVKCKLLFELAHNASKEDKDAEEVRCSFCKRLVTDLEHQKRRTNAETPTRKVKRQHPSSRARLSYMSPASQTKRRKLAQYERTNNLRKLARYEENEVTLDDEQNDEMRTIMEKIGDEELQKLYDEGEKHGIGGILKDIWITDLDRQRKEFSSDQVSNSKIPYSLCSESRCFMQVMVDEVIIGV